MSVASEITRINTNIANAYTKALEKGATAPTKQNSENLASCIESITGGGGGGSTYAPYHISFYGCQAEDLEYELANLDTSYLTYCGYMFSEMPMLMKLDLSNFDVSGKMIDFMFLNSYMLETVILNGSWLDVGDGNFFDASQLARHIFEGTPIAEGNGYIYVPDELVGDFQTNDILGEYSEQIRPLSEYGG